jgi:Asp-tRNA(Asn)/Glu-tRNA(Gln) amidotransferase A subunit family amidase
VSAGTTTEPSAVAWAGRLRARELSARELAAHYLERVAAADRTVHAVAAIDPERTLAAADDADRARAAGDERPLLGLPFTVKDSLDVAGMVCTGGSLARADHVPARDATAVARLRAAGAIVLAKTNVPEYSSSYETANVVVGRTVHPLDPARTPGGSSGGEAALAASDATPLGLGTDGGGSIRVPAHFCGVVGLRPTVGRVPDTGTWPSTRASGYGDLFCVGPLARTVEDVAAALALIAGPDGADPYAPPVPLAPAGGGDVRGLRVGVFAESPTVGVTAGTRAAVEATAAALDDAGARVGPIAPPWSPDPTELFFACVAADGGAQVREDVAAAQGRHDPGFVALLAAVSARTPSAAEWFAVLRDVHRLRAAVRALFADVDLLVCPVAAGPAPRHGEPPAGLPVAELGRFRAFDFVHLIALAGLPAMSVPVTTEDGLPVGVQLAAAPFREDVVLGAARFVETAFGGFRGVRA